MTSLVRRLFPLIPIIQNILNGIEIITDNLIMKKLLFALALLISFSSFGQTSSEYFDSGYDKAENGDYYGAISDFTKAIELDPNYAIAYHNRGWSKNKLKDYNGAIADYNKSIELDPNYTNAYVNRGLAKRKLEDNYGAIADYNKAIELDPNDAIAYNRKSEKTELLGSSSLFKRDFNLQYLLEPEHKYFIGIVNNSNFEKNIKLSVVKNKNLYGTLYYNEFVIKPNGIHFAFVQLKSGQKGRVVINSKLIMARPIIIRIKGNNMDVFHG